MLHPFPCEIVEFPLGVPSQILVPDDALNDIARVIMPLTGEGRRLQVTRRGDEGSDLSSSRGDIIRSIGQSFVVYQPKKTMTRRAEGGLTAKCSGTVDLTLPFMNLLGSNESLRVMAW